MGPRPPHRHATVALLVLAAGAVGGCGGEDDAPPVAGPAVASQSADIPGGGPVPTGTTTTTPAPLPGDSGGTGAAPADDPDAVRLALRRSPSGLVAAKTARFRFVLQDDDRTTSGTGTSDLTDRRYLATQRIGRGPALEVFGADGRSYTETEPGRNWSVTDDPGDTGDPLSLVRRLTDATVVRVGGVSRQGGGTCRSFTGTLPIRALLTDVRPEDVEDLIGKGREQGTIPVQACIDDRGRVFSADQSFVWSETFGGTLGESPGSSVTRIRVSDYGEAPAPRRPIGAAIAGAATGTIQGPG